MFSVITTQDKLQFARGGTAGLGQAFLLAEKAGRGALLRLTASHIWGPLGLGSPVPFPGAAEGWWEQSQARSRCFALDKHNHMGPHGVCVVKMERTAGRKGGLRGPDKCSWSKGMLFHLGGEGRKNRTDIPSPRGLPVTSSFFRGNTAPLDMND